MSESLAVTIAAYAFGTAAWAAARAATAHAITRGLAGATLVLELAAVGQVGAALAGLVGGHVVSDRATLAGYLLVSTATLPLAWSLASSDDSPWGAATLALALAAEGVVALRAITVWQG